MKFKAAKNVEISENSIWPISLALRISELIEEVLETEFQSIPENALEIRKEILEKYQQLTLETLLEFLWTNGIPVLYISEFPDGFKKIDGMVFNLLNRPIIIISKNRKHDAWLLFVIAHELGHLVKKHLNQLDNIIYDDNIENEIDNEEVEANEFALELLTGSADPKFSIPRNTDSAFKLFNMVIPISKQLRIDPGVITLNFAYKTKNWPLASQALNNIDPKADAVKKIKSKMKQYFKFENTTEENADFLLRVTSLSGENLETIP